MRLCATVPSQIRRFNLRTGDLVGGRVRAPKEGERYFALIKIETVNGRSPDDERDKILFDNFAPIHPRRRILLQSGDSRLQVINALMPLGFGQRIAILTPPRAGRTSLIRDLCVAISTSNPGTVIGGRAPRRGECDGRGGRRRGALQYL